MNKINCALLIVFLTLGVFLLVRACTPLVEYSIVNNVTPQGRNLLSLGAAILITTVIASIWLWLYDA